ncbi:hypothetical protein ACP4OV_029356 [Aristida adscensionis]
MASDNGSSSNSGGEGSTEPSCQAKKRKTNQTKWPVDKIVVTEIEEDGTPKDAAALRRMRSLAGLVARQRIPLKVEKITEYNKDQRLEIFDRDVMTKLEFQPEMKKDASKTFWQMVAKSRRGFRTMLTKEFAAEGIDPFDKYKFLQKEDWQAFCNLKSTQEAIEKSNKGKELRAKNKHDHHLGPGGYAVAIPKWEAEDAKMEAVGKENPWLAIPGRSRPFFRARSSTDVETGEITFYSDETRAVSQKVVQMAAESAEGSCTGVRENDLLTAALGNPEHTGRVRGVSSYTGWSKWPHCKEMYRKRKKGKVDVALIESLVEDRLAKERDKIRAEVHRDVLSLLASQGIQITPPSPADARFSSEASVGAQEQSQQVDVINSLTEPTPCILQIILRGKKIDVAKGQVHPELTILHTVPIDVSQFAIVTVDSVEEGCSDEELEMPPNDEIKTLGEARLQRIQWRRALIACKQSEEVHSLPPAPKSLAVSSNRVSKDKPLPMIKAAPSSEKSHGNKAQKEVQEKGKSTSSAAIEAEQKVGDNGNSRRNDVSNAWTLSHPKYIHGSPFLTYDEIRELGGQARALHNYYMKACKEKKNSITLYVKPKHFMKGEDYIPVNFSDLYDLYHHTGLDISILRVFTLSLIKNSRQGNKPVGFLDPNPMSSTQLLASESARDDVKNYLARALSHFHNARKECIMFPYNIISEYGTSHWVLVVILPKATTVWYIDSARHVQRDYSTLSGVIDEAFERFLSLRKMKTAS